MHWVAFAIWLAYGLFVWRRRAAVTAWARSKPMRVRLALAIALLFGGAAVLLGGVLSVEQAGGLSRPWAWPAVLACGLAFVHCQVTAAVLAVSGAAFADTSKPERPSNEQEVKKP